jgi:hypothetical protein
LLHAISELCLYQVHLGECPFYSSIAEWECQHGQSPLTKLMKIILTRGILVVCYSYPKLFYIINWPLKIIKLILLLVNYFQITPTDNVSENTLLWYIFLAMKIL